MPNRDGTGPQGNGPATGRGLGNCDTTSNPNKINKSFIRKLGSGLGKGMKRRRGRGMGQKNRFKNQGE